MDNTTAYSLPKPTYNARLTEVGRGTPCGEWLRRYWHPVGLSTDATSVPRAVRALGEDLVLFRDGGGRAGLVHARCAHRGSSLFYGKVEAEGIRCCYHGWLFDVQGHCLEQPCEPEGGAAHRDKVRQPWYPVEERYGLVWAYMGPPERQPLLPRYDVLEELAPDEFIEADASSIGTGGPVILNCNWLQHYENVIDPLHVPILHGSFSGTQFVEQMALMPKADWEPTPAGVRTTSLRKLAEGKLYRRVTEVMLPTIRVVPSVMVGRYQKVEKMGWVLPMDDHTMRIYTVCRVTSPGQLLSKGNYNGKQWHELTPEEHQRFPGDTEAQESQGPISFHSEEHLATSDRGIVMLRRMLAREIDAVEQGRDPAGVVFDQSQAYIRVTGGNFLVEG